MAELQRRGTGTRLSSVGERESDIYELFRQEALSFGAGSVAADSRRARPAAGPRPTSAGGLGGTQPVAGIQQIQVPRHGKQRVRVARLEVRFARVSLQPRKSKKSLGALALWAALSQKVQAPPGVAPLRSMLLTTCRVDSFEAACQKLSWLRRALEN